LSQDDINAVMVRAAKRGRRIVRLKGGDPFVFGRGGEEALALRAAGVPFDIVPGVTSAVAAPALAGIPVTHRGLAAGFLVVSGHDEDVFASTVSALQPGAVTIVVLMGVGRRGAIAATLIARGWPEETPAAVVVDASLPQQHVWRGTIADLAAGAVALDSDGPAALVIGDVAGFDLRDHAAGESLTTSETSDERPAAASAAAGAARTAGTRHRRAGVAPREE
jgi:uroporphyrin-III C-methyltransferase/precorrin-2 dehydrogenase/sirohydrochlorin ferrochelatase